MSRSAARSVGLVLATLAVAVMATGCGDQLENEARVPNPVDTTVKVTNVQVVVSPNTFDFGEGAGLTQPQSAATAQSEDRGVTVTERAQTAPPTNADQPLVLTIANLSDKDISLVIKGPVDAVSDVITAGETGSLKVALRTGKYVVTALGLESAKPGSIEIGPARESAQNDLLLP